MNQSIRGWLSSHFGSNSSSDPGIRNVDVTELESRVCFSASPAAAEVALSVEDVLVPEESAPGQETSVLDNRSESSARELVFIDGAVPDRDELRSLLIESFDRPVEVFFLDVNEDGVEQISDILGEFRDVSALHIVSHGSEASLQLGNATVQSQNLSGYASSLSQWQHSLTSGADILLYGCDLTSSLEGEAFAASLSLLTGADIAASDDATGHASLGGDWNFEFTVGNFETAIAFTDHVIGSWEHTLATIEVETQVDEVDGDVTSISALYADKGTDGFISLREAVIAANNTGGHDEIILGAGVYSRMATAAGELGGDIDVTDDLTIRGQDADSTILNANGIDRVIEVHGESTTLELYDLQLTGGYATGHGGGLDVGNSTVIGENVRVVGNSATSSGGGISVRNGTLSLNSATISGNHAMGMGGGIRLDGTAMISTVTIDNNSAGDVGGGLAIVGGSSTYLGLELATISGNTSDEFGGGIYAREDASITSSTIANNRSDGANAAGIAVENDAEVSIRSSIVADNLASGNLNNITGNLNSLGFNLSDSSPSQLSNATDIRGVDPLIQPLSQNGGFGRTHALDEGSVAIDGGISNTSNDLDANLTQRNAIADIGAVENRSTVSSLLFWADAGAGSIVRGNPDAGTSQTIISGLDNPVGVTVDIDNGKVYWTEVGSDTVSRANLDGTDVELFLDSSNFVNNPAGITIDPVGGKLYVVDSGLPFFVAFSPAVELAALIGSEPDRVIVANLDGSDAQTLLTTPNGSPTDLTVDHVNGKLYWSDPLEDTIHRSNLDGSNIELLVANASGPVSLAVDFQNELLYWTDNSVFGADVLRRLDLNTGVIANYTATIREPIGMAFDQDTGRLYWTEENRIVGLDLTDTSASAEVLFVQDAPFDVEAISLGANTRPTGNDDSFLVVVPMGATTTNFSDTVLANDFDPDGENFVSILVDGPANAQSFQLNTDGTFNYSPVDGFTGTDSFTYRLFDGTSPSDLVTVDLNVVTGTMAIHNGPFSVVAGQTPLTLDGTGSIDAHGTGLSYLWTLNTSTGPVTFTTDTVDVPAHLYNNGDAGVYDLTLQVTDGNSEVDLVTTSVTVFDSVKSISGVEDEQLSFQMGDFGENYDGIQFTSLPSMGTLRFNGADIAIGDELTASQIASGLTYEPAADIYGANVDSFTYSIRPTGVDGSLGSVRMDISLDPVADAPVSIVTAIAEDTQADIVISASPLDGSEVSHFRISDFQNGTLSLQDGTSVFAGDVITVAEGTNGLVFTPDADFVGTTTIYFQASSNSIDFSPTSTASVSVTPVNDAPILDDTTMLTLSSLIEGASNSIGTSIGDLGLSNDVTDVDAGSVIGVAVVGVSTDHGVWQYTLDGGSSWLDLDGAGTSDSSAVVLDESARIRFVPLPGYHGPSGTLEIRAWDQTNGALSGDLVDASIHGGTSSFSQRTLNIGLDVIEAGSVSITAPPDQTIETDEEFEFTSGTPNEIQIGNTLPDDLLEVTIREQVLVSGPHVVAGGTDSDDFVTLQGTEAELVSILDNIQLTASTVGVFELDVEIAIPGRIADFNFEDITNIGQDRTGHGNDVASGSASIVADPERGSVLYLDGTTQLTGPDNLGDPTSVTLSTWINLEDSASSPMELISIGNNLALRVHDNGQLIGFFYDGSNWLRTTYEVELAGAGWHHIAYTFDAAAATQTLYLDGVEVASTNHTETLSYSSGTGLSIGSHVNGLYKFRGLMDDARVYDQSLSGEQIAAIFAGTDFDSDQVVFDVVAPNAAPIVTGESATVDEDSQVIIPNVLANDTDPEGTNLAIDSFTQPGNGTVSFDLTTGRFTYTPDRDFHGSDSFTYTVIDEDGMSSEGTVDITVDSVNDAPVANNDDVMVDEGGTTAVLDVLANDTDVDGSTLQATLVSGPAHGTVTFNADGTFVYEHDGSETTTDEFTYAIDDSQGGTATATVGIAVRPLNDAPEAGQDSYSVDEDSTLLVDSVSGVLTNDSDAEESALTAQLVSATNFGSLTLNPDGSFSYSPNADFHGADGFSYVAVDSENGSSAVQLVEIFVDAVNDAPVPTDDSITVAEGGTTISVNAFANDVDVDGPTLLGSVLVGPNHGTVVFDSDGSFTYEHDGSETTDDHFSYFVKDSAGGEAIGNVNISITAVNDAPIAINDNVTALFTEPRTISVEELTANDLDEEMDEITIVIVQQPLHGVVTVEPDGSITYATNDFTVGTDSFDYVITDGESTSVTPGTVFVELTLPPVPPEFGGGPFTEEATMESTGTAEATTSEPVVGGDSLTIDTDEASEFGADAEDDEEDLVTLPPSYFESEVDALSPTKRDRSSLFVESSANRIGIFEYYRIPVNPSVDSGHDKLNGVSEFLASSTPISNTLLAKALVESIDSIGEDIESDLAKAGIISGSIVLASSSLSVGLVSLGVRLGYVVAGVLTSSPAWRAFDPVLISQILDEDDDDSGTIESLLTS